MNWYVIQNLLLNESIWFQLKASSNTLKSKMTCNMAATAVRSVTYSTTAARFIRQTCTAIQLAP